MFEFIFLLNRNEILQLSDREIEGSENVGIDGYFLIKFGQHEYGIYPSLGKEAEAQSFGYENVSYWMEHLLKAYLLTHERETVALHDYDGCNRWIVWVKEGESVRVSLKDAVYRNGKVDDDPFVTTLRNIEFTKIHWENELVSLDNIRNELYQKGMLFLHELETINPLILSTKSFERIRSYLEAL